MKSTYTLKSINNFSRKIESDPENIEVEKKIEQSLVDQAASSSSTQDTQSSSSSSPKPSTSNQSAFSSKQSFCRSISRAEKHLPNSPHKKTEVISNLAKKYNLKIQLKNNRGRKPKVLSEEQEKWIIDFLERPEMTYTNPGRKDHVYIGKINGEKQFVQKNTFSGP